jgi:hypothetical protein
LYLSPSSILGLPIIPSTLKSRLLHGCVGWMSVKSTRPETDSSWSERITAAQQVSESPNDTPRYLRCITYPHHTTQTNSRSIRGSIQSLSWHAPTGRNRSLVQAWCADFLHSLWQDSVSGTLALRQLQAERPSYRAGVARWWSEVVSRTAVGAGADPQAVERHLGTIVPSLMKRVSSREGYRLFDDTLVTRASSLSALRSLADNRVGTSNSPYTS